MPPPKEGGRKPDPNEMFFVRVPGSRRVKSITVHFADSGPPIPNLRLVNVNEGDPNYTSLVRALTDLSTARAEEQRPDGTTSKKVDKTRAIENFREAVWDIRRQHVQIDDLYESVIDHLSRTLPYLRDFNEYDPEQITWREDLDSEYQSAMEDYQS